MASTSDLFLQGIVRYECRECGKGFLQKCDLKRHEAIHSGNFPFKCDTCSKGKSISFNMKIEYDGFYYIESCLSVFAFISSPDFVS